MDCFPCVRLRPPIGLYDNVPASGEGIIARFMRKYYAPFLLRKEVKQAVLALFGGIFLVSIIGIQRITLGLGEFRPLRAGTLLTLPRSTISFAFRVVSCPLL
jgi:Niemann-Pick C1 protein